MSQTTTSPVEHFDANKSSDGDLSRLAELARQAYERKDTKKCLDLTRAMLLIDPDSADAQRMRSSIQSDIHRDLENSRAFLRQVHSKEDPEQDSRSSPSPVPPAPKVESDSDNLETILSPASATVPTASVPSGRTPWLVGAIIVALVVTVLGALAAGLPKLRTASTPAAASVKPAAATDNSKPVVKLSDLQPDLLLPAPPSAAAPPATATPAPTIAASPVVPVSAPAPAPRPTPKLPDKPAIAVANGTLAISSPTTVDIYKDGVYLASVPVSLELPAGTNTLEYRHGSLSKSVTHIINGNETTKATITFDVSVQINSRPWAEVFVDGIERKSLGQTPLSGVRIPIGTVLVFENQQFQTKKYRVTGNETGIQNIFP